MKRLLFILIVLGLCVSAGAGEFWPMQVGEKYEYKMTDGSHNEWTARIEFDREKKLGSHTYLHLRTWNYENDGKWEDEGYVRSTDDGIYGYNSAGQDYLEHQIAPVGTKWSYYQKRGDGLNYKVIEVVDVGPVTVPYGHFDEAYKTKRYRCKDPDDLSKGQSPDWYEWIVPGVGWVKQEDYWVDDPPCTMELVSVTRPSSVLVYNEKWSDWEIVDYDLDDQWEDDSDSSKAYIIVEPNESTAKVLCVDIWKGKDDKGKPQKYYETDTIGTFELLTAPVGKKTMCIIANDGQHIILLTGTEKSVKIGSIKRSIAAALTGQAIWDETDGDERYVGTGKLSWRLNTKMTTKISLEGLNADEAVEYIVGELEKQHYIEGD